MAKNERLIKFLTGSGDFSGNYLFKDDYGKSRRIIKVLSELQPNDLFVNVYGKEACLKDKAVTRGKTVYVTFHYILSGKGYVKYDNKIKTVKANEVLFFDCGSEVEYYPDQDDPWEYVYFGITGLMRSTVKERLGLNCVAIIQPRKPDMLRKRFLQMYNSLLNTGEKSFTSLGCLYLLLADFEKLLVKPVKDTLRRKYVKQALNFIQNNLSTNITVEEIADNCALSSAYLSRCCKEVLGITLKECLIGARMQVACSYLINTMVSVSDICRIAGYKEKKYFMKEFKKLYGVSPSEYRKMNQ